LERALLERAGVATIAGSSFGSHGEGYLRVSYANSRANIEAAMAWIRDCLAQL
jgi:aspartate/methionine/tyrosine aminotransferase